MQKVDKFFAAFLAIFAIVLLIWQPGMVKDEESEAIVTTAPVHQFWMGQEVKIYPGTIAYESSVNAGSGNQVELDPEKEYIINGYSFWYQKEKKIADSHYWDPADIDQNEGVELREGHVLLIHVCEKTPEGKLKVKGWILASSVQGQ